MRRSELELIVVLEELGYDSAHIKQIMVHKEIVRRRARAGRTKRESTQLVPAEETDEPTESPIEQLLLEAVLRLAPMITFLPQAQIGEFRVDFLFGRALIVECDGFEFHEKTIEQIDRDNRRDRALQELGYTVFRFSGSEINRRAARCAQQIIEFVQKEEAA